LATIALLRHAPGMPSHSHHAAPRELCVSCLCAYAPPKSSLCERCESELYPNSGAGLAQRIEKRSAGSDRRKRSVPVAVNLREIDRRGLLEAVAEADLLGH
jgi:hypothetical protein